MLAYWMLLGIFGIAALTHDEHGRRISNITWLSGALLLVVMIGLRRNVGGDWNAYKYIFDRITLLGWEHTFRAVDPAYTLLNLLMSAAGLGVWAVNLACAIIFTYGFLRLCRDQPSPLLAILVAIPYLVIVVAMGYTRQGAAIGLVMLALTYYFRGALGRAAFCLVLAVAFHKSAVIVIPMIALASARGRVLPAILLGLTALTTYWLFVSSSLDRLVDNYVGAHYSSAGAGIRIAMNIVPAAVFLAFRQKFAASANERRLWTIFSLASFIALAMLYLTPSSTAVDRLSLYLIPLQVIVLSRLPLAISPGAPSLAAKVGIIVYSVVVQFIWLNYADNASAWIPYHNYLTDL